MKLRKLNADGIRAFSEYLNLLETEPTRSMPINILSDPRTSEAFVKSVDVEKRAFGSRFGAAKYLHEKLGHLGIADVDRDTGLWAWLALFYFDELCPADRGGARAPGERARYIPDASFQRYYRHLLASPYRIYRAHRDKPERALAVLCQPLDKPGDIVEQLASRQEIVTNRAVMEAATLMYIEPTSKKPRRGAGGKSAGSARRYADVLNQFDLTWDLYAMLHAELSGILPNEFHRFSSAM